MWTTELADSSYGLRVPLHRGLSGHGLVWAVLSSGMTIAQALVPNASLLLRKRTEPD